MSAAAGETSPNVGRPGVSTADIVVAGAAGRMGNRIIACLADTADMRLVAALEAPGHAAIGRDAGELAGVGKAGVSVGADAVAEIIRERVLIEFSVPEASLAHLRLVAQAGARAVIGTTGFSATQRAEITETHHRFKKDAPSGTALRMAEVVAAALGRDLDQVAVYGRQGLPGERSRSEIGILSLRSGDVVGEHTVSFGTLGERLELVHKAHNRDTYARGALRAARFIVGRPAGLYSMADVLGLA